MAHSLEIHNNNIQTIHADTHTRMDDNFFCCSHFVVVVFFLFQHEELICLEYVPYDICYRFRLTFLRCTLYQDQQVHQVFAGMNQSAIHRVFSVYIFRFAWIFLVTANLSPFLVCLNWMPLMRFRLV